MQSADPRFLHRDLKCNTAQHRQTEQYSGQFHFHKNPSGCQAGHPVLISDRLQTLRDTRSHPRELPRRWLCGFRSAENRRIPCPHAGFPDAASARTHFPGMQKLLLHATDPALRVLLKGRGCRTGLPSCKVRFWRWRQPGKERRGFRRLHKLRQTRLPKRLLERRSAESVLR